MSKNKKFHNIEPRTEDYQNLSQWINVEKDRPITDEMVINFFRQIFRLLEVNNMCFSSGAFVFENYGNVLFNLLTYNKLQIDDNSYYCDDPLGIDPTITTTRIVQPANVHILGTKTHNKYYTRYPKGSPIQILPRECMPATSLSGINKLRTNTKFERLFAPKIKNICGYCDSPEMERSEPKGLALYYPFYVLSLTYPPESIQQKKTEMLYVKFEGSSVTTEPLKHTGSLISKTIGIKKEYKNVDSRREDRCDYNSLYLNKDVEFYRVYCPEDIEILNWYNTYIRLGCEFFVSKGLLIYFIKTFLLSPFNCQSETTSNIPSETTSNIPSETTTLNTPETPVSITIGYEEEELLNNIDNAFNNLVSDYSNPNDKGYNTVKNIIKNYFNKHPELKCKPKSTYTYNDMKEIREAQLNNDISRIKNIFCEYLGGRKMRKLTTKKNKRLHKKIKKNKNTKKTRKYYYKR